MVILQFNKLIRNKWFWGVFAVLISIVFVLPDDFLSSRGNGPDEGVPGEVGRLDGEAVTASDLEPVLTDLRLQRRDQTESDRDIDREAREIYAELAVAKRNGADVTDDELIRSVQSQPYFQQDGVFNRQKYQALLAQNGLTESRYEDSQRRALTHSRIDRLVAMGTSWSSPMEVARAVADRTDVLTVKVARFTQDPKAAAAVKLDDAGLRKWYDANTNSLALPERVKIRYVKFDATKTNLLARMTVTDADIQEYYDVNADRYTTTDTNGVESVKKLEEVRPEIEKTLRQIAAVDDRVTYLSTNLTARVDSNGTTNRVSCVEAIAKDNGLKVETSDWFSFTRGASVEGFMIRPEQVLPGAQEFVEQVADLDMENENFRYAVLRSDRAVWLVEKCAVSPAHVPSFAEAKDIIRPRALRDAKADAFKAVVDAEIAKGMASVLKTKDVSTNMTFAVTDLTGYAFANQNDIVPAAMKLKKGEISDCIVTYPGHALVVVCIDRKPGDPAKVEDARLQIARELSMAYVYRCQPVEAWRKWNAVRLGFTAEEKPQVGTVEEAE